MSPRPHRWSVLVALLVPLLMLMNVIPSLHAQSTVPSVFVNEFMPNLTNGKEWIELFNPHTFAVDLSGWRLDDIDTTVGAFTIIPTGTILPAGSLLVVELSENILNNTGTDAVQVFDAQGRIIDRREYTGTTSGQSYFRTPDGGDTWVKGAPTMGGWNTRVAPTMIPPDLVATANVEATAFAVTQATAVAQAEANATAVVHATSTAVASQTAEAHWNATQTPLAQTAAALAQELEATNVVLVTAQADTNTTATAVAATATARAAATSTSVAATSTAVAATASANASATAQVIETLSSGGLYISEFMANPKGADADQEWVELYNATTFLVDLGGWKLNSASASTPRVIPSGTMLAPGAYLAFRLPGTLLRNTNDTVRLLRPDGTIVDQVGYTDPREDVSRNRAADGSWYDGPPSPSAPNLLTTQATVTPTLLPLAPIPSAMPTTATATPTATPVAQYSSGARINEFLADPPGEDRGQEWVELFNSGSQTIDLSGWSIDNAEDGSPCVIPPGTSFAPGQYLLIVLPKAILRNGGDTVRLLRPDGVVVDSVAYERVKSGIGRSRAPDGSWYDGELSPGALNLPPPTPTAVPTLMPTRTAVPTRTPVPAAEATPEAGPASYASGIVLNEFLANPKNSYTSEWVELYNSSATTADISGWKIDDSEGGGAPFTIPAGATFAPGSYLVVNLSKSLLNNSGDSVRLLRPDGVVADETSFSSSRADISRSRAPDGSWYDGPPSPGAANTLAETAPVAGGLVPFGSTAQARPGATSSSPAAVSSSQQNTAAVHIRLNEVLPAPKNVFESEWVELSSSDATPGDLSGWKVDDGEGGGSPYTLPAGSIIPPNGLLVVPISKSLLNNSGDDVRLIAPDGTVVDSMSYTTSHADKSSCRIADGVWQEPCEPSPNVPNGGTAPAQAATGLVAAVVAPGGTPGQTASDSETLFAIIATPVAGTTDQPLSPARLPASMYGDLPVATPYALESSGALYTGPGAVAAVDSASAPLPSHPSPMLGALHANESGASTDSLIPAYGGVALTLVGGVLAFGWWRDQQEADPLDEDESDFE